MRFGIETFQGKEIRLFVRGYIARSNKLQLCVMKLTNRTILFFIFGAIIGCIRCAAGMFLIVIMVILVRQKTACAATRIMSVLKYVYRLVYCGIQKEARHGDGKDMSAL